MFWWLWMACGIGLLALEMLMPGGFVALFFGLSALAVGALVVAGFLAPEWQQWLSFSVLALLALAILRKPLRARLNLTGTEQSVDSMVGEQGTVIEAIPAGGSGRVDVRGSTWIARSKADQVIGVGARCRIESVDGLTLWVCHQ
jgi:inner membrane protein